MDDLQKRTKEDFVHHYQQSYGGQMLIWVTTEIMQMGQLVTLYEKAPFECLATIAERFGTRAAELRAWFSNVMAHHGRLPA